MGNYFLTDIGVFFFFESNEIFQHIFHDLIQLNVEIVIR